MLYEVITALQAVILLFALPPAFDAWMARALDRNPSKRFSGAGDLAQSLAKAMGVERAPSSTDFGPEREPDVTGDTSYNFV